MKNALNDLNKTETFTKYIYWMLYFIKIIINIIKYLSKQCQALNMPEGGMKYDHLPLRLLVSMGTSGPVSLSSLMINLLVSTTYLSTFAPLWALNKSVHARVTPNNYDKNLMSKECLNI